MTLIEFQRDMCGWLVREDADAVARFGQRAAPGLRVYQNNYRAQLVACLEESFAQTRAWIGGEAFHRAVVAHIDRVPPSSWTLDAYPRDFPATLVSLYPGDPEVGELAWIDLALGEAFVAADAAVLTASDLVDTDWDRAILHLTASVALGELTTNATAIWSALANGEVPPAVEPLPEPGAILVWRDDHAARFRAIDQQERSALLAVLSGLRFSGLCAAMVEAFGEEAGVARVGQLLGQWLADGMITGVR
jgi:hypothetical protein